MSDIAIAQVVIMALIGLSLISLFIAFLRREPDNVKRALVIAVILGALLILLQKSDIESLSFKGIKDRFFPAKLGPLKYTKDEGTSGYARYTRFLFAENEGPKINLTMSPDGKYFHLEDITGLNRILERLGLRKIWRGVPELASLTGLRSDINCYRWDDYPLGVLVIERSLCRDPDRLEAYNCISRITITVY